MTSSQRLVLYSLLVFISLGLLSYANFQRMVEHEKFYQRAKSITQKCLNLKNEIEHLDVLPPEIPYLATKDFDAEGDLRKMLDSASMSNESIEVKRPTQLEQSEFSASDLEITVDGEFRLVTLLNLLIELTTRAGTDSKTRPRYALRSLRVDDANPGQAIEGESETWRCSELTLSYLYKPDKSP